MSSNFLRLFKNLKFINCRTISTSKYNEKNSTQIYKLSNKFLNLQSSSKRKKKKSIANSLGYDAFQTGPISTKSNKNNADLHPRLVMLSKVFLEKITEILSLHDCSQELSDSGMEIIKCKINPDHSCVNVYWMCTNPLKQDYIKEELDRISSSIRHILIQQRVIGRVPKIQFIRDSNNFHISNVEKALSMADYGPDFVPFDRNHYARAEIIKKQIDDKVLKSIEIEMQHVETFDLEPSCLPLMRDDVLGVKRDKIMGMVEVGIKEMKAEHRKTRSPISSSSIMGSESIGTLSIFEQPTEPKESGHARKYNIRKWIAKYRLEKRKKFKEADYLEEMHPDKEHMDEDDFMNETEDKYVFMQDYDIDKNNEEFKWHMLT